VQNINTATKNRCSLCKSTSLLLTVNQNPYVNRKVSYALECQQSHHLETLFSSQQDLELKHKSMSNW